jgi:methionyl-tRNA formyltransferase
VWETRPPKGDPPPGPPGRIVGVGADDSLRVATGDGVLEVVRLQVEGESDTRGSDFAAALSATGTHHNGFGHGGWRDP